MLGISVVALATITELDFFVQSCLCLDFHSSFCAKLPKLKFTLDKKKCFSTKVIRFEVLQSFLKEGTLSI
jgi:hypothetical protein